MRPIVKAPARVRARNQITIPEPVAKAAGIEEGDTFLVELESDDPGLLRLRRVRDSYAGALRGVYGDAAAYLEDERRDW